MNVAVSAEKILDGAKNLKIGRDEVNVVANIRQTDAFSGHGDKDDLLRFVQSQSPEKVQKVFLVHGEVQSMHDFKDSLQQLGYQNVEMPSIGQTFEL